MKPFEKGRWQKCWNGGDAGMLLVGRKQNKREERHRHPPFRSGSRLPRLSWSGPAVDQRRGRGSHATETGAPQRGIYSRPAWKVQEGGHACFCFHSPGTFTRPHMWVLNIYPNTRSNIVWAEKEEAVGSPRKEGWRKSGGRLGPRKKGRRKERLLIRWMKVCASEPWRGLEESKFRDSNGTQMRNQKPVLETSPWWGGGSPDKRGGIRSAALLLFWPP